MELALDDATTLAVWLLPPKYIPARPSVDDPILYVAVVFIGIVLDRLPVKVMSSALELPSVAFPLNVAAPAAVMALILKSSLPSVSELMMSEKFVFQFVTLSAFYPIVLALHFGLAQHTFSPVLGAGHSWQGYILFRGSPAMRYDGQRILVLWLISVLASQPSPILPGNNLKHPCLRRR